jgi:uncharacterized protein (TIGR00725 family)
MRTVVGVMGAGTALSEAAEETAYRLGRLIAEAGWVLLNGGRDSGVMDASARGARDAGGLAIGVLPDADTRRASTHLDVAIRTGLGDGRNYVNALSSDVVVALPGKAGTLSEVCFALLAGRTVVLVGWDAGPALAEYAERGQLVRVETPEEATDVVRAMLERSDAR